MQKLTQFLIVALLAMPVAEAQAISRYNSHGMTCAQANEAARREGAVILRYPSRRVAGLPLYERAVRSSAQCGNHEYAETRYVETSDTLQCAILACAPATDDEWWLRP